MPETAGKAAVRCKAINMADLAAMEKHGKRLDKTSGRRVIRDASPLVYGSLDLRDRYNAHMEGVKQNAKASKPVLHFIVRLPPELLEGPKVGRFEGSKKDRQKMMLAQAVKFVNSTHGGSAVFAARIDRDEQGESIVDVFASPKYEKRTKRTPPDKVGATWASATKFGKELAELHEKEIRRRHPKAKAGRLTSPRMVGIALQSEFANFFQRMNGVALTAKVEKGTSVPDRLEKEAHERIEAERAAIISSAQEIAGGIRWNAEERAKEMVKAAQQVERDISRELNEGRTQLYRDRLELEEDRDDLERREDVLEKKINIIRSTHEVFQRAVALIKDKLGLSVGSNLTEDIQMIGNKLDELSAEKPRPETSGPGF